jgi:hypothetical protein
MKCFLKNTVLWLVSFSLLNSSIDVMDDVRTVQAGGNSIVEEHIEIESIAEFLLQETGNSTLPDNKENDQQIIIKKIVSFDFSIPERKEKTLPSQLQGNNCWQAISNQHQKLPKGFISIDTPPPDFISIYKA